MLHTKSFNECQKPHGNNKINLIHFYPDLWVLGSGQKLHLTKSVHNISQAGSIMHNRKVSDKKNRIKDIFSKMVPIKI